MTTDQEKKELMRMEFDAWILEISNALNRVIDLAYLQRHYIPGISYSTLAPLARGDRLPSSTNALLLEDARPAFGRILELPERIPEKINASPAALTVVHMLADMDEDSHAEVLALLRSKFGGHVII